MLLTSIFLSATSLVFYRIAKNYNFSTEYKKGRLVLPINIFAFAIGLAGIYAFFLFLDAGSRF